MADILLEKVAMFDTDLLGLLSAKATLIIHVWRPPVSSLTPPFLSGSGWCQTSASHRSAGTLQ